MIPTRVHMMSRRAHEKIFFHRIGDFFTVFTGPELPNEYELHKECRSRRLVNDFIALRLYNANYHDDFAVKHQELFGPSQT